MFKYLIPARNPEFSRNQRFHGTAIDWILSNQQIPDTLSGAAAALWRHNYGLSEVVLYYTGWCKSRLTVLFSTK